MTDKTLDRPRSVLIIDDEEGLRRLLVLGLSRRGYQVAAAANGEEGLELAKHAAFDLVVLDITMPGVGGVEALKIIKTLQPEAQVIMATGYATLETAVESMKQGAFDYISKPYQVNQLCAIFDKALEHLQAKSPVQVPKTGKKLRAPLSAIRRYSSLLLRKVYGELSPQQEKCLKRIETHIKRALDRV